MAHFCGSCGAASEGGAFCTSCGRPLDTGAPHDHPTSPPAEATRVMPPVTGPPPPQGPPLPPPPQGAPPVPPPVQQPAAYPPAQPYQQPYGQPPQQAPQQWGPPAAKVNPFTGWPVSDYVRDAAAAFALFATLGMPWELSADPKAGNQWWVVIAVLLSVASLVVPYLAKAGVVPGWGPQHYRLTRLGLHVPLLLSVLAAVLSEVVHVADDFEGGLGSGIAMALTGVALAVQPRAAEESAGPSDDGLWNKVATALVAGSLVVTAALYVLWLLHGAISDDVDLLDPFSQFLALTLAYLLVPLAMTGYPAYQLLLGARSAAWRRVLAAVGLTVPVVALLALGSDRQGLFAWPDVEKWNGVFGGAAPGAGGLLVGAAAGLLLSRAQQRATPVGDVVDSWRETVAAALQVSAAGSALTALAILVAMLDDRVGAGPIIAIVVLIAAAGAAGWALSLLGDVRRHRVVLLGVLGGIALAGCVVLGIDNGEDLTLFNNGWTVAAWLVLPALAAYGLVGPADVRAAHGPLVAGGGQPGYPQQQHPQPPYPPQPYPQQYPPQPPPPQPGGHDQPPPPSGPPLPPPGGWGGPPQG